MEIFYLIIFSLCAVAAALIYKIILLKRSADKINERFSQSFSEDTNIPVTLPARDRHFLRLANTLNTELAKMRRQQIKFRRGDAEVKNAVTNISHDLRTPLTAVGGYLDLLEDEEKSDNAKRYLSAIRDRTEYMKQLIDELFRYSVVISTVEKLNCEEVCLNAALEQSISSHYAAITKANIEPNISICGAKIIRRLDKNALSRIFANLISNAVKYSDGDLSITLAQSGAITFSNSASRLDKTQAGKLFDRFFTVENAEKSTGLGLSIAKARTEEMHGSIEAKFNDGRLYILINFPET